MTGVLIHEGFFNTSMVVSMSHRATDTEIFRNSSLVFVVRTLINQ